MRRQVHVIGLDEHHAARIDTIARERDLDVRPLLSGQVRKAPTYEFDRLERRAAAVLDREGTDGVTTYWDFPGSCLAPCLAQRRGLPTPGLRAVATFEHKYWSRLVQREVAPDDTPRFAVVDVCDPQALRRPPLDPPFWLKPIKSYSGHLGFRIDDRCDLEHALGLLRRGIGRLGHPFEQVLGRVPDQPRAVAAVPGSFAIAEEIIDGRQCTLEGHVVDGEARIHGLFDIERDDNGCTFRDYTYPSALPGDVRERMTSIAEGLIGAAGYDHAAFNIEFFWDAAADRTWILEVNPRISQEHAHLMDWVDGTTNLEIMLDSALGEAPKPVNGAGPHAASRKHFHRHRHDGVVVHAPDAQQVRAIEQRHAPCVIQVLVAEGDVLARLPDQEPYSYELAYVYLAGSSQTAIQARQQAIIDELGIVVAEPD